MPRALVLVVAVGAATLAAAGHTRAGRPAADVPAQGPAFSVVEATIPQMLSAMKQGRVTSREIVQQSLVRIAVYDKLLNAVMAVNPNALAEADARDRERREGRLRGPLHGIPIAVKDNIPTADMPTTNGALIFAGFMAPDEAAIVKQLRDAGAVIIAKTVLTELGNSVSPDMPAGYSALAGFSRNPYDPRPDPREATADGRPALSPGGSSSGVGTAVSYWAANVGGETLGSILAPSSATMLVGIKPTVGRISRTGEPASVPGQSTAGPMARTVTDAAIVLGVLESPNPDPDPGDAATKRCAAPPGRSYTQFLKRDGLKGARIGIPRAHFYRAVTPPGSDRPAGGLGREAAALMEEVIAALKAEGAVVVDPADIPSVLETDPAKNVLNWRPCWGATPKGEDGTCSTYSRYSLKRGFNAWLAALGANSPVHSLGELRQWNLNHTRATALKYGQGILDDVDAADVVAERLRAERDRAKEVFLTATSGMDAAFKTHTLDAMLFPGYSAAWIASLAGYPTVIVPAGFVPNATERAPFPDGFNARPAPYGVSFSGLACSEPRLIEIAYAFEQATRRRVPPPMAAGR